MNKEPLIVEGNCEVTVSWDDYDIDIGDKSLFTLIEDHFRPEQRKRGDSFVHGSVMLLGNVRITIENLNP